MRRALATIVVVLAAEGATLAVGCGGSTIVSGDGGGASGGSASSSGSGSTSGSMSGSGSSSSSGSASSSASSSGTASSSGSASSSSGSASGSSSGCGTSGEPCCGTSCQAGNVCVAIGGKSECEACGQAGLPCCTTMPACSALYGSCFGGAGPLMYCEGNQGLRSCATPCSDPNQTCIFNGMAGFCYACGGLGNPCCGSTCRAGLTCTSGTCQ